MTKKIVTHSGGFHADDVFAVAALEILFKDEKIEVVRTRDDDEIASGDIVLDVGFVYDAGKNRFDHHQEGGAGERENGIPYAAFGLIWKHFGEQICGSSEVTRRVDEWLVQAIDAYDNGYALYSLTHPPASPFLIQDALGMFEPAFGEQFSHNETFPKAVALAKVILERTIVYVEKEFEIREKVKEAYEGAADKRLVIFDDDFIADRITLSLLLGEYADTVYFIRRHENGLWQTVCVVNPPLFYSNRRPLPKAWAGKQEDELAAITGVPDAVFCHNECFMAVVKSKEGAIKLAELALRV